MCVKNKLKIYLIEVIKMYFKSLSEIVSYKLKTPQY